MWVSRNVNWYDGRLENLSVRITYLLLNLYRFMKLRRFLYFYASLLFYRFLFALLKIWSSVFFGHGEFEIYFKEIVIIYILLKYVINIKFFIFILFFFFFYNSNDVICISLKFIHELLPEVEYSTDLSSRGVNKIARSILISP